MIITKSLIVSAIGNCGIDRYTIESHGSLSDFFFIPIMNIQIILEKILVSVNLSL